jgi:hypothetical protein
MDGREEEEDDLDLSGGTDTGNRETDVDGGTDTSEKQFCFQEDLSYY